MPIKSVDFPTFEPVHFVFAKTSIKDCLRVCSLCYSSFPQSKNKHAKVDGVCPICVLAVKLSESVRVFIEKVRKSSIRSFRGPSKSIKH